MLSRRHGFALFTTVLLLLLLDHSVVAVRRRKDGNPQARSVRLINDSGVKIDVFWINSQTRELAPSNTDGEGVEFGAETGINSYIGHAFEIQEVPHKKTNKCLRFTCQKAYFTVNANEDQWLTIKRDFSVIHEDTKTRATQAAKTAMKGCDTSSILQDTTLTPTEQLDAVAACMEAQIQKTLDATEQEIAFQAEIRQSMGQKLIPYTCTDVKAKMTESVHNSTWSYVIPETAKHQNFPVQILFESDFNTLHLIKGFWTPKQCAAVLAAQTEIVTTTDSYQQARLLTASPSTPDVYNALTMMEGVLVAVLGTKMTREPAAWTTMPVIHTEKGMLAADQECAVDAADGSCTPLDASGATGALRVDDESKPMLASMLVNCGSAEGNNNLFQGGALHFPRTGTHIRANETVGDLVVRLYQSPDGRRETKEAYLTEYVQCPVLQGDLVTVEQHFYLE